MPLDEQDGAKVLQLITSRFNQREWRKKIEKTLSFPPSGFHDELQRKTFIHLKLKLQAYKSRRADPPSWIVGGFATKEVIDRIRYSPKDIDETFTQDDVKNLGVDPGDEVDEIWWEDMLVRWFEEPESELIQNEEDLQTSEELQDQNSADDPPKNKKTAQSISQESE